MNVLKILTITVTLFFISTDISSFTTDRKADGSFETKPIAYAVIKVSGKALSKKLNVNVDFGDAPEQLKEGKRYSELLSSRESYAAVLNGMEEVGYELVQTLTTTSSLDGGTSGLIFIMKNKT